MSLILKQETASSVPTPAFGKGTVFLTETGTLAVKDADGNNVSFLTISTANDTEVLFNDAGAIGQSTNFTYTNSTNTLTVANLSVTGTLNAGDITVSSISNGTSNVDIIGVNGNITISVAGIANVLVVSETGVDITGTLSTTGNANVGNLGTAQVLASANITAPQLISNVATGTAPFVVASTTLVPNLYVARANVSDYSAVTTATTGNYYLNFVNAVTGNVTAYANATFVANAANGAITATTATSRRSGNRYARASNLYWRSACWPNRCACRLNWSAVQSACATNVRARDVVSRRNEQIQNC